MCPSLRTISLKLLHTVEFFRMTCSLNQVPQHGRQGKPKTSWCLRCQILPCFPDDMAASASPCLQCSRFTTLLPFTFLLLCPSLPFPMQRVEGGMESSRQSEMGTSPTHYFCWHHGWDGPGWRKAPMAVITLTSEKRESIATAHWAFLPPPLLTCRSGGMKA